MKKKIFTVIMSAFVCLSICVLVGCKSQSQDNQSNEKTISIKYGVKSDSTKTLTLTNTTGQDVTAVKVQLVGDSASKDLAPSDNNIWSNDATAEIYLDEGKGSTANTQSGGVQLKAAYDITFVLKDNSSITLHNLTQAGLSDYADAKLCINSADKIGYIEYKDPSGASLNTLAGEQKIAADKKAADDAAAKAAADAAAAQEQDTSESGSGGYAGSSSGGQSTDDCTGGNIKLR
ncbi:MAG: hypothetical protein Q4E88_06235 [Coriobacteriia bacterium]|nr:hypothetical protein [Coriobacteriia bacterium]